MKKARKLTAKQQENVRVFIESYKEAYGCDVICRWENGHYLVETVGVIPDRHHSYDAFFARLYVRKYLSAKQAGQASPVSAI